MLDKIEGDRKAAIGKGQRWGGEPPRRQQLGDIPPVIDEWRPRQLDFAHHLRPAVQRFAGLAPGGQRQFGPGAMISHRKCASSLLAYAYPLVSTSAPP